MGGEALRGDGEERAAYQRLSAPAERRCGRDRTPDFDLSLQIQVAQPRVTVRPPAQRPEILAVGCLDRQIVDAGVTARHVALIGEFPVLIAIAAKPLARVVMPL